jgi:Protein of function (DUF2518)
LSVTKKKKPKLPTVIFTTADLFRFAQWSSIATIAIAVLTVVAFILQWGFRFRLVGVTGFMGVLSGGFFALGLGLFAHTTIPNAARYSLVYDNGGSQVVVAVSPQITATQVEATLRQAASDLFSYGRLGQAQNQMEIRVRTVIHPQPGVSEPLYLGEVKRSLAARNDEQMAIEIYAENLAKLPQPTA